MKKAKGASRKAAWISLFIVALAASLQVVAGNEEVKLEVTEADSKASLEDVTNVNAHLLAKVPAENSYDEKNIAEANNAYKEALRIISTMPTYPPPHSSGILDAQPSTILTTLFPNQQGPIASLIRIIYKLRQQTWLPKFLTSGGGSDRKGKTGVKAQLLEEKAERIVGLLNYAAELGHTSALYTLAEVSLFHPSEMLHNVTRAFDAYTTHAALTGNSTSQALVAFFYATGYDNVVDLDQAKALLYYTFAAFGGNLGAQMTLGYRHWAGIGVNDECMQSLEWYQMAAEQSMVKFLAGPPGGRTLLPTFTKLSDLDGGAYGPGSSVASTGHNAGRAVIRSASARRAGETWEDVLDYYMFNAERGELDFAYRLGKIFYQGSIYALPGGTASGTEGVGALPRDYARARAYFLRIARLIWPHDTPGIHSKSNVKQEYKEDGTLGYAALSAGMLGRMYLRGEGFKQDAVMAKMWFDRGAEFGCKECSNGLGIIFRDGLVGDVRDINKAAAYFGTAATQNLAEAQVNLGKLHYQKGDIKLATTYFDSAVRQGSPFEAYYYLAEIYASSAQNPSSPQHHKQGACTMALSYYKIVAERGAWGDDPLRDGEELWKIGTERAKQDAILHWMIAAERGFEAAQNNLAYIFDQDKSFRSRRSSSQVPSNETAHLALTHWTRSAFQRNVDALVKVGDYYYHGLGVPDEPEKVRHERAAAFYQAAVDTQVSALAMWNLGWMYENGVGVPQDFHLAKRHYDMAVETNSEADIPVLLSLAKLYLRSLWHSLRNEENGLSVWFEEDWFSPVEQQVQDDQLETEGIEEDPVEWARRRRQAEDDRDADFGPEDYFDAATRHPGRRRGGSDVGGPAGGNNNNNNANANANVEEDDFGETMVLVILCLGISMLVYLRGRWNDRRRRERQERAQAARGDSDGAPPPPPPVPGAVPQNPDATANVDRNGNPNHGGLFLPPGDPNRDDWVAR